MNLIILFPNDFIDTGLVSLEDNRFRHIKSVLKSKTGDLIKVGVINGKIGQGLVKSIDSNSVQLQVDLLSDPPPPVAVTLLCAVTRPKTLKKVLQASASLGVKDIYLMGTWRSDKSYWQSPLLEDQNIKNQFLIGLEQARDTIMPNLYKRPLFKPFVQDELPTIAAGTDAFVAQPNNQKSEFRNAETPVTLAVGPEGGFIHYEIDLLKSIGFKEISLGPRPLRVENAVVALLAQFL